MARGEIFMRLPGQKDSHVWRTDLKGHGPVILGEEFIARECSFTGAKLEKEGRKLRVRVVRVRRKAIGNADLIYVEILADLTPTVKFGELLF